MTPRVPFLVLSLLLSLSAAAQLPRNEVTLSGGWTELASIGGERSVGASYARFWNPALAAKLGVIAADRFSDAHAMVQIHPLHARLLSPWAGVGAALVRITNYPGRSDSKVTGIVGGGVDVRISPRLALGAEVHYSPYEVNPRDRFGYNVNPATFTLAARWRY